jgi:hypothetical protein
MVASRRFASPWPFWQELALDAVQTITVDHGEGRREIDIK